MPISFIQNCEHVPGILHSLMSTHLVSPCSLKLLGRKKKMVKLESIKSVNLKLTHYNSHNRIQLVCQRIFDHIGRFWIYIRLPYSYSVRLGLPDSQLLYHKLWYLVCTFRRRNRTQWHGHTALSEQLKGLSKQKQIRFRWFCLSIFSLSAYFFLSMLLL